MNATACLNHENIMSGEPSQSSKAQILEFYLYEISRIIKLLRTERRQAVPRVGVGGTGVCLTVIVPVWGQLWRQGWGHSVNVANATYKVGS